MKQRVRTAKTHMRSEQGKMRNVAVWLLLISYDFEQLQGRVEQQVARIEAERISAIRQAVAGASRSN